jgi:hypothetical protein
MTEKHPSEMSDSELESAIRRKAWRAPAASPPADPEADELAAAQKRVDDAAAVLATEKARIRNEAAAKTTAAMTDQQINQAMRTRAWRTPHSQI